MFSKIIGLILTVSIYLTCSAASLKHNISCISPKTILKKTSLYKITHQLFKTPLGSQFSARRIQKFKNQSKDSSSMPIIELLNNCTNNCKICIYNKGRLSKSIQSHIKPFDNVKQNLIELKKSGIEKVSLCFDFDSFNYYDQEADKDLLDILNEINNLGIEVWVTTHFGHLNNKNSLRNIERISKHLSFPLHFNISLHAWHNNVFQSVYPKISKKEFVDSLSKVIKDPEAVEYKWNQYLSTNYLINSKIKEQMIVTDHFLQDQKLHRTQIFKNTKEAQILSSLNDLFFQQRRELEKQLPKPDLNDKNILLSLGSCQQVADDIEIDFKLFEKQLINDALFTANEHDKIKQVWQTLQSKGLIVLNKDKNWSVNYYTLKDNIEEQQETVWKQDTNKQQTVLTYKTISQLIEQKKETLQEKRSQALKKHSEKFIHAIGSLQKNPNCQINLVPITSTEIFPSIQDFHLELFKIIEKELNLKVGDFWDIEFLLGSAKDLATQYGYQLPNMYSDYFSVSSKFSGIFFIMGADGNFYLVAEAVPLERIDIRDLLGDLVEKEGYTVDHVDFQMSNVFWYKITPPEEKKALTNTIPNKALQPIETSS